MGHLYFEKVLDFLFHIISVGFGETKTLAKLALELAKKSPKADGVLDLTGSPYQV
jgi:nucleotidyltransferase/DNA polymerase involved in DNA repair